MHSALLVAAGSLLFAIGVVGLVLPVVPGLLLLAAAAACFARARSRQ
jgi:uncharacterized membrane protein YbaN (DUF454 family)